MMSRAVVARDEGDGLDGWPCGRADRFERRPFQNGQCRQILELSPGTQAWWAADSSAERAISAAQAQRGVAVTNDSRPSAGSRCARRRAVCPRARAPQRLVRTCRRDRSRCAGASSPTRSCWLGWTPRSAETTQESPQAETESWHEHGSILSVSPTPGS